MYSGRLISASFFLKNFCVVLFLLVSLNASSQNWLNITASGPDWINCGDLDVAGNQLTIEALITKTFNSPGQDIVSKHTGPVDVNYLLRPGGFEITTTNGYTSVASSIPINLNQTYHVAAVYDGTFIYYYVNGCETGRAPCTGNMVQNNLLTAIGNQSTCQCEPFTGYIDEVRIWNVARTPAQLQANMNTLPTPGAQVGLMAYYNNNVDYVNQQGNVTFDGAPVGAPFLSINPFDSTPLQTFNSIITSTNVDCNAVANGTIQTATAGGNPVYQYSLNGGANQTSNTFPNLIAGNYTVTVTSADGNCIQQLPVTLIEPPALVINITNQTNVSCFAGNDGALTLSASGGTAPVIFSWQPNVSSTNTATNLMAGQYTITLTDNVCHSSGAELVNNGSFSSGNTGFSSSYLFTLPPNTGEGQYWVATGSQVGSWNGGMFSNGDHTSGVGEFMMVNGSGTPGTSVWCQTIPVTANTDYNFSSWVSSLNASIPAQLQFSINGVPLGATFSAPATSGSWVQYFGAWNSGASTSANICIVNQNTSLGGNDFGLDDISFQSCTKQCSTTAVITITEPAVLTQTLTAVNSTICPGNSSTLTDSLLGGTAPYTVSWSSGGSNVGTPVSTIVSPMVTTQYYAAVIDFNGCLDTVYTTVTVSPSPALTVNSATLCVGANATLTGNGATTYTWSPATGLSATTGTSVTANPILTTTYTVLGAIGTCTSTATSVVTVNPLPVITVNSVTVCVGTAATLTAAGATTYTWSTFATGVSITDSPLTTTSYTVVGTDNNACSNFATTAITVNQLPIVTVNSGAICFGNSISLNANGASTYSWTPSTGLSATTGASVTSNPVATTTYVITGTDINNCVSTASSTVTVNPVPVTTVNSATICTGSSATLTANGATTYVWSPAGGLSATTGTSVSANPNATTAYMVVGSIGTCTSSATANLTVNPLPIVTANSATVCIGNSATLTAAGASTYLWSNAVANVSLTISPLSTSSFTVIGTDANNCVGSVVASITVNPLPIVVVNSATICDGNSATLTAVGANTFTWSPATALSSTTGASVTANPNSTTSYVITGTNLNNCLSSANSTVIVNSLPTVNVTTDTICIGNTGTLSASGASSYNWTPNTGLSSPVGATVGANPTTTTNYTVTGTDVNGCVNTNTTIVTVNPLPIVLSMPQITTGCAPLCVDFSNTTTSVGTCSWTFGTGSPFTNCAQNYCFTNQGNYTAQLTFTDTNGCVGVSSSFISVYPVPVANFYSTPQPANILEPTVTFYDGSSNAFITTWAWAFGDPLNSIASSQNTNFTYLSPGSYPVTLVVTSDFGCTNSTTQLILVEENFSIYVPNAFTPNNDTDNALFMAKGEGISEFKMYIFDRWGNQLFDTNDIDTGWDGRHKNKGNDIVCEDVYVWKIELTTFKGEKQLLSGIVSLIK